MHMCVQFEVSITNICEIIGIKMELLAKRTIMAAK